MPIARQHQDMVKRLWVSPDSFASSLLLLFVDEYGNEEPVDDHEVTPCLNWDPETIVSEIEDDLQIQLPRYSIDKLMTAVCLARPDKSADFYQSLPDFIVFCNILSGDTFDPRLPDPADAAECAWGINEALVLAPPNQSDENPFAPEIVAYIGKVLDDEGIIQPPGVLRLGLVGGQDKSGEVGSVFADDPEMYGAIWKVQKAKSEDIEEIVHSRLRSLFAQIGSLPLQNGSAAHLAQRMSAIIGRSSA